MQFLVSTAGAGEAEIIAGLKEQGHVGHGMGELGEGVDVRDVAGLFTALAEKQWGLVTNDNALVRRVYEEGVRFDYTIVLLLEGVEAAGAMGRLFERYKRLSAGRLYTVTGTRVKIRQLPGSAGGGGR
ncbi:MAG TPA: hypothetical protein VH253_11615 [Phycisphaerae bacterium]|nr:hypothetical protein [Phycisphaerae bacterium]